MLRRHCRRSRQGTVCSWSARPGCKSQGHRPRAQGRDVGRQSRRRTVCSLLRHCRPSRPPGRPRGRGQATGTHCRMGTAGRRWRSRWRCMCRWGRLQAAALGRHTQSRGHRVGRPSRPPGCSGPSGKPQGRTPLRDSGRQPGRMCSCRRRPDCRLRLDMPVVKKRLRRKTLPRDMPHSLTHQGRRRSCLPGRGWGRRAGSSRRGQPGRARSWWRWRSHMRRRGKGRRRRR